jgi:hypothetical protein
MLTLLFALLLQTHTQPAQASPLPLPPGTITVDFAGTDCSDVHVAAFQAFPVVHRLILADTHVTDAGIAQIAGLKNFAVLERIDLANANVTDAAIPHLLALKNLRQINLAGTKITKAGRAKLRKALPHLRIRG